MRGEGRQEGPRQRRHSLATGARVHTTRATRRFARCARTASPRMLEGALHSSSSISRLGSSTGLTCPLGPYLVGCVTVGTATTAQGCPVTTPRCGHTSRQAGPDSAERSCRLQQRRGQRQRQPPNAGRQRWGDGGFRSGGTRCAALRWEHVPELVHMDHRCVGEIIHDIPCVYACIVHRGPAKHKRAR